MRRDRESEEKGERQRKEGERRRERGVQRKEEKRIATNGTMLGRCQHQPEKERTMMPR